MTTWQKVKFKDFISLQRGFDLPKGSRSSGKYPVVASTSIVGHHSKYRVSAPCVTTGRSGALGEVLFTNEKCWPLNTTLWVKDFKGNDPKYTYFKLKTLNLQKFNAGAGVPTLNKNHLDTIQLNIPDLPTQKKIASVLSTYDDLIENNEKRIKTLEEMAQLLYTEWFVKFKFPGHEKVKMIDSGTEFSQIPEGWYVGSINDISRVVSGFPFKGSIYRERGRYKIVTIKNVHDGKFVLNFSSFVDELPAKLPTECILENGDILLSLTGNVGRICIVYGNDHVLNQRVAKLDPKNKNEREFIYLLFRQKRFRKKMEAMSNGAAQLNLSPIQVKNVKIIIPKASVLDEFSNLAGAYFDVSVLLQEKNHNLSKTRDLLILQLVTERLS